MSSGLVIGIPFYKNPNFVSTIGKSLEELQLPSYLTIEFAFLIDSPDDNVLKEEVERWSAVLSRRYNTFVIMNDKNLGYVKSANKILKYAVDRSSDVVLVNSDVKLYTDTIKEMIRVLDSDPMIAFVAPRTNNTTLCTFPFPGSDDEIASYRAYTALRNLLPQKIYVPTIPGFCMLCRTSVLNDIGLFDERYGLGYSEENDLIMRANRLGYTAAVANWAFAYHEGGASFGLHKKSQRLRIENESMLNERFPEYPEAVKQYFNSPEHNALVLLSQFSPETQKSVAFDLSSFGTHYNGTFEYGLRVMNAFCDRFRGQYELSAICSKEVWAFHKLEKFQGLNRSEVDSSQRFTFVVRLGQPFNVDHLNLPFTRGAVVLIAMLDPIAHDCAYLNIRARNQTILWHMVFDCADVVLYISDFVRRQFVERFDVDDRKGVVILPSLSMGDYLLTGEEVTSDGSLLVIGNKFHHKYVRETVSAIKEECPELRLRVLGTKINCVDIESYESGNLDQTLVSSLFGKAEAVIFPTFYEGFGFPVMYALAAKKPIFVRRLPVFEEINGYLKSTNIQFFNSTEDLVEKIKRGIPAWADQQIDTNLPSWTDVASSIEVVLRRHSRETDYAKLVNRLRQLAALRASTSSNYESEQLRLRVSNLKKKLAYTSALKKKLAYTSAREKALQANARLLRPVRLRAHLPSYGVLSMGIGIALTCAGLIWKDIDPTLQRIWLFFGVAMILDGAIERYMELRVSQGAVEERPPRWLACWHAYVKRDDICPFRRLIPLDEAAKRAMRETHQSFVSEGATRLGRDTEGTLPYFATLFTNDSKSLHGFHQPSGAFVAIPQDVIKQGHISDDATSLSMSGEDTPRYTGLAIFERDFRRRLAELKT